MNYSHLNSQKKKPVRITNIMKKFNTKTSLAVKTHYKTTLKSITMDRSNRTPKEKGVHAY